MSLVVLLHQLLMCMCFYQFAKEHSQVCNFPIFSYYLLLLYGSNSKNSTSVKVITNLRGNYSISWVLWYHYCGTCGIQLHNGKSVWYVSTKISQTWTRLNNRYGIKALLHFLVKKSGKPKWQLQHAYMRSGIMGVESQRFDIANNSKIMTD